MESAALSLITEKGPRPEARVFMLSLFSECSAESDIDGIQPVVACCAPVPPCMFCPRVELVSQGKVKVCPMTCTDPMFGAPSESSPK